MKLQSLMIKNFRGISFAEIDIDNFTTLVGPNNIGKSTILHALNLILDNKKPKIEDWPGQKESDEEMEIKCIFHKIEDWERRKPAISKLLHEDQLIIKMTASWNEEKTEFVHEYSVYNSEVQYPWSEENFSTVKKNPEVNKIFSNFNVSKKADFDSQREEIEAFTQENYSDLVTTSTDWHVKKFANSLQQAVPHVMYVPASFKIEDELKSTNNSPFSFLFTNKLFPHVKRDDSYQDYIGRAEHLQNKLQGKLEEENEIEGLSDALKQVSDTLNQVLDFDSKIRLAIGDIDIEPLFMKAATFLVDDEIETSLAYQGSGVQRALAFAMLESNATAEAEVAGNERSIIVLYEEPELYIHPHLMRRLKNTLQERSNSEKWQVICSTHSPFLINIAERPESLKLLSRGANNQRNVHQISEDIFEKDGEYDERMMLRAALDFHPTVCESLFAKRAVIVEGDTEIAVFSRIGDLAKKLGTKELIDKDTTLVSAGGKWTIPALARVLNCLNIEYRIIHDTDRKEFTDDELEKLPAIHPYNG